MSCTVHRERRNCDTHVNNYDHRFIDFLQYNNLYILNGRTGGDKIGSLTCKGSSAVDYFICSPNVFKLISSLNVHDFYPLLSDAHNPISLTLSFNVLENDEKIYFKKNPILWNEKKQTEYIQSLNMDKINAIEKSLNNLKSTTNTIKQEHIDELVNSISTFFTDHAKYVFGEKNVKQRDLL